MKKKIITNTYLNEVIKHEIKLFLDKDIDLYGAVYYTRAVLREELQKNGIKTK